MFYGCIWPGKWALEEGRTECAVGAAWHIYGLCRLAFPAQLSGLSELAPSRVGGRGEGAWSGGLPAIELEGGKGDRVLGVHKESHQDIVLCREFSWHKGHWNKQGRCSVTETFTCSAPSNPPMHHDNCDTAVWMALLPFCRRSAEGLKSPPS